MAVVGEQRGRRVAERGRGGRLRGARGARKSLAQQGVLHPGEVVLSADDVPLGGSRLPDHDTTEPGVGLAEAAELGEKGVHLGGLQEVGLAGRGRGYIARQADEDLGLLVVRRDLGVVEPRREGDVLAVAWVADLVEAGARRACRRVVKLDPDEIEMGVCDYGGHGCVGNLALRRGGDVVFSVVEETFQAVDHGRGNDLLIGADRGLNIEVKSIDLCSLERANDVGIAPSTEGIPQELGKALSRWNALDVVVSRDGATD